MTCRQAINQAPAFPLKVTRFNKSIILDWINVLPEDASYVVDVYPPKKPRSGDQNAALFGLAYKVIREETGNDVNDLHDYFCGEYFGWKETDVMGAVKKKPIRSTTRNEEGKKDVLGTIEMADFFSFVQQRAGEIGIYIPDPDPNWQLK